MMLGTYSDGDRSGGAWLPSARRLGIWGFACLAAFLGTVVLASCHRGRPEPVFTEVESPLRGHKLNDLGAVDADGDGVLDLFTTNHEYAARLLRGDGRGGFTDVTDEKTLGIAPGLPGLETTRAVRPAKRHGLHVFFLRKELFFDVDFPLGKGRRVGASVEFPRPVAWVAEGKMRVDGSGSALSGKARVLKFVSNGSGRLKIMAGVPDLGVKVRIEEGTPLSLVSIGSLGIPTATREFELTQIDRHGMAWADFDADGDLDVFITRGGRLGAISDAANDELLINRGERYRDAAASAGIRKRRGRGRRVAWVDYNSDGLLDLYVGNLATPNQLYVQGPVGKFTEGAAAAGIDLEDGDVFRWLDVDGDADPDLVTAGREGDAVVWLNDSGKLSPRPIAGSETVTPVHIAPADFDRDGDLDLLIVDTDQSVVLLGENKFFATRLASSFGLPNANLTANWVDFDNDGLVDLHAIPRGMFRQQPSGLFEHVGLRLAEMPKGGRCAWLDFDTDGDRDGVCELPQRLLQIQHRAYRNDTRAGNWLALDLVGGSSRRQQVGATVVATIGGRREMHIVGEAEGAHFSQGHSRIYLGLGDHSSVDRLEIKWPNGRSQVVESVGVNQRMTIARSE